MSNSEKDPLDGYEPRPLREQIEPYEKYGDAELAVTLLLFEKKNSNPGINTPANVGFTYYCPTCEENVRQVSRGPESVGKCPLCGEWPGALALGSGPK